MPPVFRIALAILAAIPLALHAAPRPNIVIIMADDMGYSDIGCYGSEIETPNLDKLAANGLRFSQYHNTGRCCPTRASLLTGLYSHQAGIGDMTGDYGYPSYQGYLNDRCLTIAEALKPAGYTTLTCGKWHVGGAKGQWPAARGFDHSYGTPTGGGVYFKENLKTRGAFTLQLDNQVIEFPDNWYCTDAFTDYAIQFVDEASKKDNPFFLYLAHIAPHWPLQAKEEDIAKYRDRYHVGWDQIRKERHQKMIDLGLLPKDIVLSPRDPEAKAWDKESEKVQDEMALRMAIYAAQIDCIDQNMGRFVAKLEELGKLDDTLILFCSDNGSSAEGGPHGFNKEPQLRPDQRGSYASAGLSWANAANTPFRRHKSWVHEGGISSPLIAHWPAGIGRKGEIENQVAHVIDFMPTCLDLAGAEYPKTHNGKELTPLPGTSLIPAFHGKPIDRGDLFWEHEGNRAIREGDWKLVAVRNGPWELYDLSKDRTELNNLAKEKPEIAKELGRKWQSWADDAGVLPYPVKRKKKGKP